MSSALPPVRKAPPGASRAPLASLAGSTGVPAFVLQLVGVEPSSTPPEAIEKVRARVGERAWAAAKDASSDAEREIILLGALRAAGGGTQGAPPSAAPAASQPSARAATLPALSPKMTEIARSDGVDPAELARCAAANMPASLSAPILSTKASERLKRNGIDPELLAAATAANLGCCPERTP